MASPATGGGAQPQRLPRERPAVRGDVTHQVGRHGVAHGVAGPRVPQRAPGQGMEPEQERHDLKDAIPDEIAAANVGQLVASAARGPPPHSSSVQAPSGRTTTGRASPVRNGVDACDDRTTHRRGPSRAAVSRFSASIQSGAGCASLTTRASRPGGEPEPDRQDENARRPESHEEPRQVPGPICRIDDATRRGVVRV